MAGYTGTTAGREEPWMLDPWSGPPPRAWAADVDVLLAAMEADRVRGLAASEAATRLRRFGPNRLEPEAPVPAWRKIAAQFADPLVYLLIAALAISILAWILEGTPGFPFEPVVIGVILILNAVLGYVQEARAERAVAALQRMAATTAAVIRDGEERRIPSDEVVPGDVLVLGEGDAVAADARLLEASALSVSEASLTGESEPVDKNADRLSPPVALADRTNMVFAGTAVTRGRGRALVIGTGMNTEVGRIAELLETTEQERTPLQREIDHVGRVLGVAVLLVAVVVVTAIALTSEIRDASDVIGVLIVGVSLAVAAVPEGLPAVLSVVLALGVQRMARRNAIVKELSSVETLGSASVICSDKTGTLTRNEMTIRPDRDALRIVEVTGSDTAGRRADDRRPSIPAPSSTRYVSSCRGSLAGNASLQEEDGAWVVHGDPTDAAFLVVQGRSRPRPGSRSTDVAEVPFTSERKLI
ncbi:MAG: HAD-IC family P-type ATPase [Actinomycetota bacterium]